jgi:hypothetical protein
LLEKPGFEFDWVAQRFTAAITGLFFIAGFSR